MPDTEDNDPAMLQEAAAEYGLSNHEMARLLGISDKTFYNLMKADKLDLNQSDRFQFVSSILKEGRHAFMGISNFKDWLHSEQVTLGGATPVSKLSTLMGAQEVLAVITRIKHGIFA